jgi:hypothetical protein
MESDGRTSTDAVVAPRHAQAVGNLAYFGKVVFGGTYFGTSPDV